MDILNKLKNLLKKSVVKDTNLSNLNSHIPLINRNSLDSSSLVLKELDDIKTKYLRILASKRTIVSTHFGNNDIHEEIKMDQTLIMNLLDDEEAEISFVQINLEEETKELDYLCKMEKFKIYIQNIELIWENVLIKLTALNEIKREKVFLSPNKKQALNEEINNLESLYLSMQNIIMGLTKEIESYKINYSLNSMKTGELNLSQLKQSKRKELEGMFKLVMPEKLKVLQTVKNEMLAISLMESELEKYVYTHKEKIEELKSELDLLDDKVNNETNTVKENMEFFNQLELKFKIFSMYGKKEISFDDIYKLYSLKFDILTQVLPLPEDFNILDNISKIEVEIFMDIIFKKVNNLINGKYYYDMNIIEKVVKILKQGKDYYSFYDILGDRESLSLLLYVEEHRLSYFFRDIIKDKKDYDKKVNFHNSFIKWEEKMPFESICTVARFNKINLNNPYYDLFKYYAEKGDILEGIKIIDLNLQPKRSEDNIPNMVYMAKEDQAFFDMLKKYLNYVIVRFPSSLESINADFYFGACITELILNNGLKSLLGPMFKNATISKFHVPCSLENISSMAVSETKIGEIIFEDFLESKLESFSRGNLLQSLFEVIPTGKRETHHPSRYSIEKQNAYREGRYSSFADSDLFDRYYEYVEYKIRPIVKKISVTVNGNLISLDLGKLEFISYRIDYWSEMEKRLEKLNYEESDKIWNLMREQVLDILNEREKDNVKKLVQE